MPFRCVEYLKHAEDERSFIVPLLSFTPSLDFFDVIEVDVSRLLLLFPVLFKDLSSILSLIIKKKRILNEFMKT